MKLVLFLENMYTYKNFVNKNKNANNSKLATPYANVTYKKDKKCRSLLEYTIRYMITSSCNWNI